MTRLSTFSRFLLFLLSLFLLLLSACQPLAGEVRDLSMYANIPDKEAASLLQKAMDASGGLATWNSLKMISFEKRFALFSENGEVEQDLNQYYIQRNDYAEGSNNREEKKDLIYQLGSDLIRIGGEVNPELSGTALRNTVLSASFVISLPFKLLDEGAELTYAGKDTLDRGQEVEVLQVVYNPETNANHSTPDIWWHYFDAETHTHLAYMVKHADHFSYVENLSQTEAGGIVFPLSRKSWRVDENRNLLWLRAEYEYSNYHVGGI